MAKRSKKKKRPPEIVPGNAAQTKEILPGKSSGVPWHTLVQALAIAAAVLCIYWPALHGDWLWDDNDDITDNPITQSPTGLWSIWFAPGSQHDYYPIKASVQWLQWHLWGMDTLGYHLTNVLLHILSALLVWRLLSKFKLQLAWLGGLIFALHPVQVESVAWISELKNTLSLPPFLLAMCAWIDFDERGKSKDYFLALGLFLMAMLCKTTMVMFPVTILLYAWWKRGRIRWEDVKTSAPFFAVSLALGLLTVWCQLHNHNAGSDMIPAALGGIFSRLACAGLALSFYFSKCFLPVELMPIYPRWVVDPPTLAQFLPWPILGGTLCWLWTKRQSWGRHALLGLGFFLILLAPFLGLNAISYMNFTWVMNHFLYLPIIGLIGLAVAAFGHLESQLPASFRPCGIGLLAVVLALLAFQSRSYAEMFIDSETLWTSELQRNPQAYPACNNLGLALSRQGRLAEAIGQFEQALRIYPDDAIAHNNLGNVLFKTGRVPEAIEQFQQALRIKPDYAEARYDLATVLLNTGRVSEAIGQFEDAVRIKPDYAQAHNDLGDALQQTGQLPEAVDQYQQALQIRPDYADAHNNLGFALYQSGRIPEAIDHYEQALRIDPDCASACYNLGVAMLQTGHTPEAMEQFEQALRIKPDYAEAHNNFGAVLWQMGRQSEAIGQFHQSIQINPQNAEAHNNLGSVLSQIGRFPEALAQFELALRIRPDFTAARNNLEKLQALQQAAPPKN